MISETSEVLPVHSPCISLVGVFLGSGLVLQDWCNTENVVTISNLKEVTRAETEEKE